MSEEQDKVVIVDSLSPWERRLDKHGWPVIFLVIFGLCTRSVVLWVAPYADMAVTKHFEGFDKMIVTQGQIAETQNKQAENGRELVEISRQHRDQTEQIGKKIDEVHRAVIRSPDTGK
jgi:hypothetical protein